MTITHTQQTFGLECLSSLPPVGYNHLGRVEIMLFIGMNIVFWNCQGLIPKLKELHNYLLENQIDILALNETFLEPKFKFHLPGYDIYKNDRLVGTKSGVAILVKKGIIVNQEWKNEHLNIITVKPNKSGQTLVNIAKDLKLFYVNQLCNNRHRMKTYFMAHPTF